jgi:hypothetical protein
MVGYAPTSPHRTTRKEKIRILRGKGHSIHILHEPKRRGK